MTGVDHDGKIKVLNWNSGRMMDLEFGRGGGIMRLNKVQFQTGSGNIWKTF
jgi:hypothetical protein